MSQSRYQYLHVQALVPSLIISMMYLIVELLVISGVFFVVGNIEGVYLLTSIVFTIVLLEGVHRTDSVNLRVIRVILVQITNLQWVVRRVMSQRLFTYRVIVWLFWLLTAAFITWGYGFLNVGIQIGGMARPADSVTSGLAIVSGALAIYFTIAAVVVQHLLEKYSQVLLRKVVRAPVFLCTFAFLILFMIGGLILLHYDSNEFLDTLAFGSTVYSVLCLGLMTALLIYFLDVTNVVAYTAQAIGSIIRRIPKGTAWPLPRRGGQDIGEGMGRVELVNQFIETWILGAFRPPSLRGLPSIDVPEEIVTELQEALRPIWSTCLKAIGEDNRDVVLSCLSEIEQAGCAYIDKRRDYGGMSDRFLSFICGQLEILYNAAIQVRNQQYTADIIATGRSVALACTDARQTQIRPEENGLVFSWISFLKGAVIKAIRLEHTSAPMDAIQAMTTIGSVLIKNHGLTTAIYGVCEGLRELSNVTISLGGAWPITLAQSSIAGRVSMLASLFENIRTGRGIREHDVSKVCDGLEESMKYGYKMDTDIMTYSTLSAPLVGSLWLRGTIADIIRFNLSESCQDPRDELQCLRQAERLVKMLRSIGAMAVKENKGHSYEYFLSFAEIAHTAIHHVRKMRMVNGDPNLKDAKVEASERLLKSVVGEAANLFSWYPNSIGHGMDYLKNLSPVAAFLTYYASKETSDAIRQCRNDFLENLLDAYKAFVIKEGNDKHRKEELYRYLKLYAAWLYKRDRRDPVLIKITKVLAIDYPEPSKHHFIPDSPMEQLGYPVDHIAGQWFIYPSDYWPDEQWEVTNTLNDLGVYEHFDRILSRMSKKRGKVKA